MTSMPRLFCNPQLIRPIIRDTLPRSVPDIPLMHRSVCNRYYVIQVLFVTEVRQIELYLECG